MIKIPYACIILLHTGLLVSQVNFNDSIPSVVKNASVVRLASDYLFTEGPASDKSGNVFFTDQPNDRILKWTAIDGTITEWMKPCGRSNGLYFDSKGNLVACADEHNQLWSIDINKKSTILIKEFDGKIFNGPNDLWIDKKDDIYFTDPFYKREYWDHSESELKVMRVYFYNKLTGKTSVAAEDFRQPNGIVGSKDGRKLYIADIGAWKTYVFDITKNGKLVNRKLFCSQGSDGMTTDEKGNVYLSGRGVTVYDKSGKRLGNIPIPEPWTANLTFGGKDKKTLFITASKSVYTLAMKIKGA